MGDRKIDKAREMPFFPSTRSSFLILIGTWFNRAVTLDPDFGDAWAHFYKFEQINGSKDNTDSIIQRVKKAQPRHGECCVSSARRFGFSSSSFFR
jgi:hypothetical protein